MASDVIVELEIDSNTYTGSCSSEGNDPERLNDAVDDLINDIASKPGNANVYKADEIIFRSGNTNSEMAEIAF